MKKEDFQQLLSELISAGYEEEINWQRKVQPVSSAIDFAYETVWVILNSGMKEQIARKIWDKIQYSWKEGGKTSDAFNHQGKVKAIDFVMREKERLFREYQQAGNKVEYLETIPFIGIITKWHLAKNFGVDCVKPDRHLVRIASQYGMTPDELCNKLSKETGEKKCVVDIVIWRACNLQWI